MKKVKFTGKLSLNKETIAKLNDEQMNLLKGGDVRSSDQVCSYFSCNQLSCLATCGTK